MKTEWDYTLLASSYLKRPDYSQEAIDKMSAFSGIRKGAAICDVGAGVAHLTLMLARRGMRVSSVEPNDAMRELGKKRTTNYPNVCWHDGTGESTGQQAHVFDMVTFGSSFNVTDRAAALKETARILKPAGWFACMWNHRKLDDSIQKAIEEIIHKNIPGYSYGARREDQAPIIQASGLFGPVEKIEGMIVHEQSVKDVVEAWGSHATLQRQAGTMFHNIISQIEEMLTGLHRDNIQTAYTTRIWLAQLEDSQDKR